MLFYVQHDVWILVTFLTLDLRQDSSASTTERDEPKQKKLTKAATCQKSLVVWKNFML